MCTLTSLDTGKETCTIGYMTKKPGISNPSIPAFDQGFVSATVKHFGDLVRDEGNDGLANVGDSADLAQQLYDLWPRSSPWDSIVGPVYNTSQLATILETSRQAISDRVKRGTLLGLRTADHRVVYPLFQFRGREVIAGLSDVLKLTKDKVDDWTLASWLMAPQSNNKSVIEDLRERGMTIELLERTVSAAQRWSR
jgi:hypothetical protein